MYKLVANQNRYGENLEAPNIIRTTDNAIIPKDEANTDYQEYLKWVAEGNTPEEAE